jgi:hypothetical protein
MDGVENMCEKKVFLTTLRLGRGREVDVADDGELVDLFLEEMTTFLVVGVASITLASFLVVEASSLLLQLLLLKDLAGVATRGVFWKDAEMELRATILACRKDRLGVIVVVMVTLVDADGAVLVSLVGTNVAREICRRRLPRGIESDGAMLLGSFLLFIVVIDNAVILVVQVERLGGEDVSHNHGVEKGCIQRMAK